MELSLTPASGPQRMNAAQDTSALERTAEKFEAAILADLLRAAGAGQARSEFGGGIGEDQFSSLLVDAHAGRIAAAGGIGLAEMVLRGLLAHTAPQAAP